MSRHDDRTRLLHILDAARKARQFVAGLTREDLRGNEILALALVRLLEIIGEAARAVSTEYRERHPEIAWSQIVGLRNRLIHGYADVDLNIVWQIISDDLPDLIRELEKHVPENRQ